MIWIDWILIAKGHTIKEIILVKLLGLKVE
jgi:hypothetical protein